MKSATSLLCVILLAAAAQAGTVAGPERLISDADGIHGALVDGAAASRDTVLLIGRWGSGAAHNGQFETPAGVPAWNGWTHGDRTIGDGPHWQVADYNAAGLAGHPAGNLALWCGELDYPTCDPTDTPGGYGNNWNEALVWRGAVADPGQPCVVTIDGWLNIDTEPAYDYVYLEYESAAQGTMQLEVWDGVYDNLHLQRQFIVQPADYVDGEVVVVLRFDSDSGWSDEDCSYWTAGALQLDDVEIWLGNGGLSTFNDFENGEMAPWTAREPAGVGDFAHLESGLDDLDECSTNLTPQVCWVDDGVVVPGTGGSECQTWCYGPGGYVVNGSGGLLGDGYFLDNALYSPVMAWPAGREGATVAYDVYIHEPWNYDSPGIYTSWAMRSTDSADPADIEDAPWESRNIIFWMTGPDYTRVSAQAGDLLVPGATYAQMMFFVRQVGWMWGGWGDDATPAPYFDNARVTAYDYEGPSLYAAPIDLAGDAFPASGGLDLEDLGSNSVRFDMGRNISPAVDMRIDPGDSVVITAGDMGGAALMGAPRMHYRLQRNPVFDAYRAGGLPDDGYVEGELAANTDDRWGFDLPDEGFLFPGDVLHYYFAADDVRGGRSLLPADTTGFGDFDAVATYDLNFTMHALPSVREAGAGEYAVPSALFWDDAAGRGGSEEWAFALANLGLERGVGCDVYRTKQAISGAGNGLGARATVAQIAGYDEILYSCGRLDRMTLSVGDFNYDPSPDVQLLDSWLRLGDRDLLLTGSGLVTDLSGSAVGQAFRDEWMGVVWLSYSVTQIADLPDSPYVVPDAGNGVLGESLRWLVYGGCPWIEPFDAVEPAPGAVRLAHFTADGAVAQPVDLSAATLNVSESTGSRVISLPYDLSGIWSRPGAEKAASSAAVRAEVLADVLAYFQNAGPVGDPAGTESPVRALAVDSYPNPFNPVTTIRFDLPRDGRVTVDVYDAKGRHIRALLDELRLSGTGSVVWDGRDGAGASVASGLYFCVVGTENEMTRRKIVLLK